MHTYILPLLSGFSLATIHTITYKVQMVQVHYKIILKGMSKNVVGLITNLLSYLP